VKALQTLAGRVRGTGDVLFAAAALAAVSLLVAPVPPWLVDAGLATSLALSASVLVAALLAREALQLSAFPTILLLSTLLRLALSVASTRLVLARGEAGRVVQAFGEVVVQGSPVVGVVIFAILTLVQLLVVAKGAERVAEVAARFALDALPGKQMSIDADLRNGAADAAEARRRRRALEREGQLHGAMDGALKFVKGDALAGVAIVLVNAAGGLVAGLMRGMPLELAARRYAVLAVGDGLASQIPGLLVAVAASVVVTRVAGEDDGASLGADVARQLLSDPRALGAVGVLCGGLALLPGVPAAPFGALAIAAGLGARLAASRPARAAAMVEVPAAGLAPAEPVILELAPDLHEAARGEGRFLAEVEPILRELLWREMGVRLPALSVREARLGAGRWRLLVEEVPLAGGRAERDAALALVPPEELRLAGIAGRPASHPLTGARAALVPAAQAQRASALGPVLQPLDRLLAAAGAALCQGAHRLVGVEEAQALVEALEAQAPALAREVARQLPPALLAEVVRRLLEEGVPVRALRTCAQAMLEAGGAARPAASLAEACRRALGRHLAHRLAPEGPLDALLLDPEVESAMRQALAAGAPPLDAARAAALLAHLEGELEASGAQALLTAPDVRRAVRDLVAPRFPRLAVLSYEELPPEWPVRPRARIALAA